MRVWDAMANKRAIYRNSGGCVFWGRREPCCLRVPPWQHHTHTDARRKDNIFGLCRSIHSTIYRREISVFGSPGSSQRHRPSPLGCVCVWLMDAARVSVGALSRASSLNPPPPRFIRPPQHAHVNTTPTQKLDPAGLSNRCTRTAQGQRG